MRFLVKFSISLLFFLPLQYAMCFTLNSTLSVTATVGGGANCVLGSTGSIKFPDYYSFSTNPVYAIGTVTVTCLSNLAFDMGIDKGQSAGATENHRFLTKQGGNQQLSYKVFKDARHERVYGTTGENTLHQVATGFTDVISIYGEIPANQLAESGTYVDQLTISVTF